MSVGVSRVEHLVDVVPGVPEVADLADVWLVHALGCLLDACDVPDADRRRLVESGVDSFEPEISRRSTATDESVGLRRLDACRRALAFAALAVESRLNRVLKRCTAAERQALSRLAPAERFSLAARLLAGEGATVDVELGDLVVEVFRGRDELVEAGASTSEALTEVRQLSPSRARGMVETSAKICGFLTTLAVEEGSGTAQLVSQVAGKLARRADHFGVVRPSGPPGPEWDWNGFGDFPPNIIGT